MYKISLPLIFSIFLLSGPMTMSSLATKDVKQDNNKASKNISEKIAQYKKRLERLLSPVDYHYVAAGKPDPFKPFFRTEMKKGVRANSKTVKKRPESCDAPLECMDVGQLTLVGIVLQSDGNALAMAQDASGIGYTLRVGTRIGYNNGKVVSIARDRVVVREKVEDLRGKPTFRDRTLYLHPEEGDESS